MKMYAEMPGAERAAKKFLAKIQQTNPHAYAVIASRIGRHVLNGMGENETPPPKPGLWDSIKDGLTDLAATGVSIWRDKEIAEEQQRQLEREAQAALERERLELQRMQTQRENAALQYQIAEEQGRIAQIMDNIKFNKYQKIGLWVAGGLVGLLVAGRTFGWFN